jgi:hypothetical protein
MVLVSPIAEEIDDSGTPMRIKPPRSSKCRRGKTPDR